LWKVGFPNETVQQNLVHRMGEFGLAAIDELGLYRVLEN
jgi:hypothetical protein